MREAPSRRPSIKAVAVEQLRIVGLAVRREAITVCAGVALFLLFIPFVEEVAEGGPVILDPSDLGMLAAVLALAAPLGVWKGEKLFGESQLWSLPMDHAPHARMKVAAGWVWLMSVVAFGLLSFVLFALLVGGVVGADEIRLLATDPEAARSGAAGPLRDVRWTTPFWQWVLPFTAATAVYLMASAVLLGFRRPLTYAAGGWLLFLALGGLGEDGRVLWATATLDGLLAAVDWLVTGGSASAQMSVVLDSGERVRAWARLPSFGSWAGATALWMVLAVTSVWAASARHREG